MCDVKINILKSTIFLSVLLITQISYAVSLNLAWDPNQEEDLDGYKIYYGTSTGEYGTPVDVGANEEYELSGLNEGWTYYIALAAYDTLQNESEKSEETSIFIEISEVCTDGIDNDENGYTDCEDSDCDGASCDDGDPCTDGDACTEGICLGTDIDCVEEPLDLVIEAEEMSYHANGQQQGEFWNLWANGVMSEDIEFPDTDVYRFEIIVKGRLAFDVGPEMGLLIDGEIKDSIFVNTETPETFTFDVEISVGTHEFAIGFYNDYYELEEGIDRNLYVDKTIVTVSPVLVIEAEEMSYHANGQQQGDYWNLWANGVMSEDIDFPDTGIYRFEIIAKGRLAFDVGPEMGLFIDGEIKDSIFVNTETPETFVFDFEVTEGTHEFAIGFYNDYYNPSEGIDRNLYIDRTLLKISSTP